jgi:hypothetical protein
MEQNLSPRNCPRIAPSSLINSCQIQLCSVESGTHPYSHQRQCDRMSDSSLSQIESLFSSDLKTPAPDLPTNFPNVEMPRFLYGDSLCWLSDGEVTDWGIVIGRFYSFAPYCCCWRWSYLLWLDSNSPSSAWLSADIAWEDDLEPMESKETL